MIQITEVRNAVSLREDNTQIDAEINHPQHGWIPYTVALDADTPYDDAALLALIGDDFAPYVPPTQAELDEAEALYVRGLRNIILSQDVDPLVTNPLRWADLTSVQQAEWSTYRQALLDVPQQDGFPHNVTWPTKP